MDILQEGVPFVKANLRSEQGGAFAMAFFKDIKQ